MDLVVKWEGVNSVSSFPASHSFPSPHLSPFPFSPFLLPSPTSPPLSSPLLPQCQSGAPALSPRSQGAGGLAALA